MRIVIGVSIALLLVWLVGQMIGFGLGLLRARRRSRDIFERRLRRNDLPDDVIDEIMRRYQSPGLIRDLIRSNVS